MGLDMYLTRKMYLGAKYEWNEISGSVQLTKKGKDIPIEIKQLNEIVEDVAYWRKANAIHKWFVDNVQNENDDCGTYELGSDTLGMLLAVCKKIKDKCKMVAGKVKNGQNLVDGEWRDILVDGFIIENPEVPQKLLPTTDGFFFGSTDYDNYYMQDIDYTIEVLESALKRDKELEQLGLDVCYEYSSSW